MLDVFERIVEEELQLGHILDLVADPLPEGPADKPVLMLDLLHRRGTPVKGEDADVDLGIAEIGRDTHGRDRDERPADDAGPLLLEDLGHVLLYLFGDFLLSCGFHGLNIYNPYLKTSRFFSRLGRGFHVEKPSLLNR